MTIYVNIELIDKKKGFSYADSDHVIEGTTNKELIQEAKRILREMYGVTTNRTQPVFNDVLEGTIRTGFATSFWGKYEGKRFNGEAWVTFNETKSIDLDNYRGK